MKQLNTMIHVILLVLSIVSLSYAQNATDLRNNWQHISELVAASGYVEDADRILESVNALTDEQLEQAYNNVDLLNMITALEEVKNAVDAINMIETTSSASSQELSLTPERSLRASIVTSTTFPTDLDYPDSNYCPLSPGRSNGLALQIAVDAIQAARIALEVAKGVWSGLSRGCDQTVVILGEGGNTSTLCIPADIALFVAEGLVGAAEGVVEHFEACDSGVDSAEIEASWKGIQHINSLFEAHIDQLDSHDADIKDELSVINAKLDAQKGMLETVLANQQMIIQLLKTPSGKRPGWNK